MKISFIIMCPFEMELAPVIIVLIRTSVGTSQIQSVLMSNHMSTRFWLPSANVRNWRRKKKHNRAPVPHFLALATPMANSSSFTKLPSKSGLTCSLFQIHQPSKPRLSSLPFVFYFASSLHRPTLHSPAHLLLQTTT